MDALLLAFITVLDIVPRLHQLTRMPHRIASSEHAITLGVVFWTCTDFFDWDVSYPFLFQIIFGLFAGCFVGLLAAALTEIVNVLPILAKRLRLQQWIVYLLMAMVFGKIVGSLMQWLLTIP
mgnify:CR=1 FL=1